MGNNYISHIISATKYIYTGVASFVPHLNLHTTIMLWVISYIIVSLACVIHILSNNLNLFQEYRFNLLITTPHTSE